MTPGPSDSYEGKSGERPSESDAQAERESALSTPTPRASEAEKRVFAWRRWHGIGPEGRKIEQWTQQEIADAVGVSERTVRRWVNEEPAPIFEGLPRRDRQLLFGMALAGNSEAFAEYLILLSLEGRLGREPSTESEDVASSPVLESESPPFAGLGEDFDPW